jgi:hypothetical protein
MSADPYVDEPMNTQAFNRYSYVRNNPLTFTDPNGFGFFSSIFHAVASVVKSVVNTVVQEVKAVATNPQALAAIAVAVALGPESAWALVSTSSFGGISATAAAILNTGIAGGLAGAISTGNVKGALIGVATAEAFYGVGEATGHNPAFGTGDYFANVAGHAAVGCASAEAGGGSCGPQAFAAGAGAAVGPMVGSNRFVGTSVSALVGGTAAALGGGKFANGAVTAAFGYLFNWSGDGGPYSRADLMGMGLSSNEQNAFLEGQQNGMLLGAAVGVPIVAGGAAAVELGAGALSVEAGGILNPNIYTQLEKQLIQDGPASIDKALDSARQTLLDHLAKRETATYTSQIDKTIRNVRNQIETIRQFKNDNGL